MFLRRRMPIVSAVVTGVALFAPLSGAHAAVVQPTTVTLTSPADGSQAASGTVAVTAVGTVDPTQVGAGFFVDLLVDGQVADSESCPAPASPSCAVTLSWATYDATGTHTLQARFNTYDTNDTDVVVLSAPISVTIHIPTTSTIQPVDPLPYGHTAHLSGEVLTSTGAPLAGVPVQVVEQPASGKAIVTTLQTDTEGQWTLAYKAKVITSVVARVAESPSWGGSHASRTISVFATGKCTTKDLVDAKAPDSMSCTKTVPALAKGSTVLVQLLVHKKWHTLVTAKVSGAKFSVPFRLTTRGTAEVRLYLPATKTLTSSETNTFFIAVV